MTRTRYEQYDYDFASPDGPIAALQARSTNPNFPGMVCPPKGWIDLVVALDRDLAAIVPDYTIAQVKEKFAGLRFYIGSYGEVSEEQRSKARELINEAERASYDLCQVCGGQADGSLGESGWQSTLCETHRLPPNDT